MCNNSSTKERRPLLRTSSQPTVSAFSLPYRKPMFRKDDNDKLRRVSMHRMSKNMQIISALCILGVMLLLMTLTTVTLPKSSLLESVRLRGGNDNNNNINANETMIDTTTLRHPFHVIWPHETLPQWAVKSPPSTLYPPPYTIPASKRVCLVHVGKTAGSTVGCRLGFNLHCERDRTVAPGLLPRYTTHMFHTNVYDCPDDDTADVDGDSTTGYYLFVVRNPLTRIQSAFSYDKPKDWDEFRVTMGEKYYWARKRLYDDCQFDTLEDMARRGLISANATTTTAKKNNNNNTASSPECRRRAVASLLGTEHFGCHFYYNYQFHYEGIFNHPTSSSNNTAATSKKKIITIRTEHIIRDWNSVEVELGGQPNIMGTPDTAVLSKNNVNTHKADSEKYLSDESRMAICNLLCNDIQVYKEILHKSVNLDEEQVRVSMEELRVSCPTEADSSTCTDRKPNIQQKLLEDRGYVGKTRVISPYELHWQGRWSLPHYMTKNYMKYPAKTSSDKEVCFVHVGKVGGAGVAVGCALGFNLQECQQTSSIVNDGITPGLLPQYTTRQFHCGIYDCFDDSAYYMFVVTDPLTRFASAFHSDIPTDWEDFRSKHGERQYNFHKELFMDCPFHSLEELIYLGVADSGNRNTSNVCRQRALGAIDGSGHYGTQMYYNYQYYVEGLPKDAKIIAIRSEHLMEDWNSAESMIGGVENILSPDQTILTNDVSSEVEMLSDDSKRLLCEKLCNEIQVYKKVLTVAMNLNTKQKQKSFEELKASCPKEAATESCEADLPDITSKLYLSRGYDEELRLDSPSGGISIGRSLHPEPPSPYEMIWPDLKLPSYMKKDRQYPIESVPTDKKTCFVHVGKTAGSTVGCAIGFNLHCNNKVTAPGVFSQYATHMFHSQMYNCEDDSAYFVFVVRNPLERMISAFNYDNPSKDWEKFRREYGEKHYNFRKKLYMDCPFTTFDELAQRGLSSHGDATDVCRLRAAAAIDGTEHFGCHFYFNYQFHLEAIPQDATIMTIRTEHLIEDWNTVECKLGGEEMALGPNQTVLAHNNANNASGDKLKYLSAESKTLICEKLCNEIQTYKKILRKSINLSEEQVMESIKELNESCPLIAFAETCSSPLPNITEKLIDSRGYLKKN